MSTTFIGQIMMFAGSFAPEGYRFCDGSLVNVSDYPELYSLIGATYGGTPPNSFALPDLRGRVPVHQGAGLTFGQSGGAEQVTLNTAQLPSHTHPPATTGAAGTTNVPSQAMILANQSSGTSVQVYAPATTTNQTQFGPASIGVAGDNAAHPNMQPFQAINFCIATTGVYPQSN